MMEVETTLDIKTTNINEINKNNDPDEQNKNIKFDEVTKEKTDSFTEHSDEMTENENSLKSFNCVTRTIQDNDNDTENQTYTEQRLETGKLQIENEQRNTSDSVNNLFLTELEKRISKINSEPSDDTYIESVESYKSLVTSSTLSENNNKGIKHGEETETKKVEEREDEMDTYTYQRKIEPVVTRTVSDIMINTTKSGKDMKTKIDETEERMEENYSGIEKGQNSGDIGIDQIHKERLMCVETKQEYNNAGYLADYQRTNTTKTKQIGEYSKYLESNYSSGNLNQISMNSRTSETVTSGFNDTIHMIEINKHVTKNGFTNETVVKNLMAQSNQTCQETDQIEGMVVNDLRCEISDINNDTVVKGSLQLSDVNDINGDTAMDENVLRSKVKATKDNKSTTMKIKDVRFSLPDVLVNMDDMRPTQRSISLEDLAVKDSMRDVDIENDVKTSDIDIRANDDMLDKNAETGRNGDHNGFNELLKGFYKTRDLIRREMSYTKEWDKEEQPIDNETCENPDIILEVSELDTESKEPNNSNINANTNIVTVTSVMLDDEEDLAGKQNVSSAFATNEKVSNFHEGKQTLSFGCAENGVVSVAESIEESCARREDMNDTESDNRLTAFSENPYVFTEKETEDWSANLQNENSSSVNMDKDDNMTLLTQKTLIVDRGKSYVNCISVKSDTTHSNMDIEQGQHDILESYVPGPVFSAKSFLNKGTQTESDLDKFNVRPVFEQRFSATRSNLILSKANTDMTNIKGKSLPTVPYRPVGRKTKGNRNVHDWFHRNDTTQLSTLTLRGHYPDMSYIDEPYYISRSWQRENDDTSIPYYPFFDGEISRNSYGIDTKSLSRKIYLPTTSERYKKLNPRSSWANSKSTWVKRLYTNPNHNRYLSRRYHSKYDYRKPETYYAGSVDCDYQQRPDRYLLTSPGFITIIPEVEKSDGCFQRNKCIWPLLAVISALMILILVSVIVIILIL